MIILILRALVGFVHKIKSEMDFFLMLYNHFVNQNDCQQSSGNQIDLLQNRLRIALTHSPTLQKYIIAYDFLFSLLIVFLFLFIHLAFIYSKTLKYSP